MGTTQKNTATNERPLVLSVPNIARSIIDFVELSYPELKVEASSVHLIACNKDKGNKRVTIFPIISAYL